MLSDIRNKAKDIFSQMGYPSTKEEMWRYTSTKNFASCISENIENPSCQLDDINLPEKSCNIIFCNGQLVKWDTTFKEIKIHRYDDLISSSISPENFLKLSDFTDSGVVAHNTSAFTDALHLTIDQDKKLKIPINIYLFIFITSYY